MWGFTDSNSSAVVEHVKANSFIIDSREKNKTTKKRLEIQAKSCDYFESCHTWFKIPDFDLPEDLKW